MKGFVIKSECIPQVVGNTRSFFLSICQFIDILIMDKTTLFNNGEACLILPQVKEFWDKKSEEFGAVNLEEVECPLQLDINQLTLDEDENPDI